MARKSLGKSAGVALKAFGNFVALIDMIHGYFLKHKIAHACASIFRIAFLFFRISVERSNSSALQSFSLMGLSSDTSVESTYRREIDHSQLTVEFM